MKILLADDHPIIRAGLKQILNELAGLQLIDEAINGNEVIAKTRNNEYDLIILDISLPDRNGLDVLKQIRTEKPGALVLILSIHPEEQYAKRVLKAGASGYLTKNSAPEELLKAANKILSGGKYISETFAEIIAEDLARDSFRQVHELLSDREYQIMCLIASGKSYEEIGLELCISPKTVRSYRARILDKMKLQDNAHLISYCVKNNLID